MCSRRISVGESLVRKRGISGAGGAGFASCRSFRKSSRSSSQPNKEISHIAALSDFRRQLNNFCVRNHLPDAKRAFSAGFVVVKADINLGYRFKFFGPLFPKRSGAAR